MLRAGERLDEIGVAQFGSGNMKPEKHRSGVAAIRHLATRAHQPHAQPPRPKLSERITKRVKAWLG